MLGKGYMYRNLRNYSSYSKILSAFNSPIFEEGYGAFKITLIAQKRMADKEYKNEWKLLAHYEYKLHFITNSQNYF